MANLIIKSSADNLVLQGSDASPAITVGATGTTTFAENATLSGTANNLGTATAGTLGSSVVFPAGKVVQTTVPNRAATYTTGTPGSWSASVVNGSITPLYDNSAIIIFANWCGDVDGETGGDFGFGVKWVKTGTGVVNASGSPLIGPVIQEEGHSYMYRNSFNYARLTNGHCDVLMDNDCETTNEITYTMHFVTYEVNGNIRIGGNNWDNHQWSVYFQEIKR